MSVKRLWLDLGVLGAAGHVCITAAESQNSTEELTGLFLGQGPLVLASPHELADWQPEVNTGSSQAAAAMQVTQEPTANRAGKEQLPSEITLH